MTANALRVVRTGVWCVHWGGIGDTGAPGLWGQVTECLAGGDRFYVREGLAGIDHFAMCSAARLGMKQGRAPRGSTEVLHLACAQTKWDRLAALVREADANGRLVVKHRLFSVRTAERLFEGQP